MKIKISMALLGTAITFLMSCGPVDMNNVDSQIGGSNDVSAKVVDQDVAPSNDLNLSEQNTNNYWYGGAGFYYRYYPGLYWYYTPYHYSREYGRYTYYPYFGCRGVVTGPVATPSCR